MLDPIERERPPAAAEPDAIALFRERLAPIVERFSELPWSLTLEVRTDPPSTVFRASAPGELCFPVTLGDRPVHVAFRWPLQGPDREVVVAVAVAAVRGVAAGVEAELRTVRSSRRAARAERLVVVRSLEVQVARAEVEQTRRERDEARRRYEDAERRVTEHEGITAASAMLASVAHDIRSPLTSLLCNLRALEEDLGDAVSEQAAEILGDTELACEVIEDVLDSVRTFASRSGTAALVPLSGVVGSAARLFRWHAARAGVEVDVRADDGVQAWGTPSELCQIVVALLSNAADAAGKGGKVRLVAEPAGEGRALIRVVDDGPGIAPGDVEKIFAPFYSKKNDGLGLGLSVARAMARRHGGDLVALPTAKGHRGATLEVHLEGRPRSAEIVLGSGGLELPR